jgi:predicted nucleic acid-binding Zn ribbon protein
MAKGPQRIGDILPQLMAQKGFARVHSAAQFAAAWSEAAGELAARYSRVGALRRGTLEIIVANSALVQEFVFQKSGILETLNRLLPEQGIRDLRFRVGAIT